VVVRGDIRLSRCWTRCALSNGVADSAQRIMRHDRYRV
jgi:hypothetical protein